MQRNYSINELEQLQQRAIEGDSESRKSWAMAVQYGDSVWAGFGGACHWYQLASEHGLPISAGDPGRLYFVRQARFNQDIEKGLSLLISGMEEGDARASANMSLSNSYGPGVEINPENAASLAQKAIARESRPHNRLAPR